jgi:hypothetical protein
VDDLDDLRRPAPGGPLPALVTGVVSGVPDEAIVVVTVDGVVQGGSRVSRDSDGTGGRFAVLLRQGALDDENEIGIAVVVDGRPEAVTISGR